jgi:hypothetical protein
VRQYGRNGLQAQVLKLNIQQAPPSSSSSSSDGSEQQQQQQPLVSVRVLPKEVHMNSVSLEVENFRFLFCPPERLVSLLSHTLCLFRPPNQLCWYALHVCFAAAAAVTAAAAAGVSVGTLQGGSHELC